MTTLDDLEGFDSDKSEYETDSDAETEYEDDDEEQPKATPKATPKAQPKATPKAQPKATPKAQPQPVTPRPSDQEAASAVREALKRGTVRINTDHPVKVAEREVKALLTVYRKSIGKLKGKKDIIDLHNELRGGLECDFSNIIQAIPRTFGVPNRVYTTVDRCLELQMTRVEKWLE
jgi:pyruvate/2-oxoglutarate dehydrogenase complex dihydrolipoamide acyltransferase (E2) component